MKYTYALNPSHPPLNASYTPEELRQLTTLQLREICIKEKLVIGVAYKLDRQYMINTILKYRGAKLKTFVDSYIAESFESVIEKFSGMYNFVPARDILIPVRITLFKNMDLGSHDRCIVEGEGLKEGNALLLDNNNNILGILNIVLINGKLHLCCNHELLFAGLEATLYKNYSIGFLDEKGSKYLHDYYYGYQHRSMNNFCYTVPVSELHIVSVQAAKTPLVIDFGTSNSSAGAYLDEHYVYNQVKWDLLKNGIIFNDINKVKFKVLGMNDYDEDTCSFDNENLAGDTIESKGVGEFYNAFNGNLSDGMFGSVLGDIRRKTYRGFVARGLGAENTEDLADGTKEIIPSIISIKSCSDPDNIVYRYGYDALHYNKRYGYNSPASVFYNIKRWVNNYNKIEDVSDEEGNIAHVPRLEILRAYFEHIITLACQQHKCHYKTLHITSPVKQKQQFLEMYKAALPGYDIITKTALDEGIAVLYNSISNQIEKRRFDEKQEYKALIIDCGGGTTDLTSSTYYIEDNQITYELDLTTTYANGETNFGGNNITYRIFQYLKIAFSKYYTTPDRNIKSDNIMTDRTAAANKNAMPAGIITSLPYQQVISIEDVFDEDLEDIYRHVDENGHESVYSKLESMYNTCESIIPTRYHDYRNAGTEDYMKVRSNFYFLWNLSEKIKIDFFHTYSVAHTSFHLYGIKDDAGNPKITSEESWRLNIYKDTMKYTARKNITRYNRELVLHTDFPNIVITKEEVSMLIKADVYSIIKKFIEPIYDSEGLDQFDFIKLTGQTCKIDIFRDALKEFIPGKVIESSKKQKTINDFKLTCLEGAIKYQNARVIGLIAPEIINNAPITPYKLTAYTHTGAEVTMISSLKELPQSYGFVSRNIDTENMELILRNADGKVLHKYPLNTNREHFRPTDYVETTADFSEKIPQDDIDSIVDNEIKIFTYALEDKWGFFVLPLARADGTLLMGENKYFPFENDEWELNFFDGEK